MRRRMQPSPWWIGLALPLLLLGAGGLDTKSEPDDGIDVYFRDSDLESLAKQDLAEFRATDAGESKRFEKSFPDAPPQIPHTVDDMLPITLEMNECLDCHHPSNAIGKEDLPLPKSHFKKPVMAAGSEGEPMVWKVKSYEEAKDIVGTRYNCTMCHAPQAENARVIGDVFSTIKGKPTQ